MTTPDDSPPPPSTSDDPALDRPNPAAPPTAAPPPPADGFTLLQRGILKAKGLSDQHLATLASMEVTSVAAFPVIGDAGTLQQLLGVEARIAEDVMAWALAAAATESGPTAATPTAAASAPQPAAPVTMVSVDSPATVRCANCDHKQPHDYKTGDLCPNCGRQAEPLSTCYWCHNTGTGKFCRACGAAFVRNLDYEIAVLLKREGMPKSSIARELEDMSDGEKQSRLNQLRSGRY